LRIWFQPVSLYDLPPRHYVEECGALQAILTSATAAKAAAAAAAESAASATSAAAFAFSPAGAVAALLARLPLLTRLGPGGGGAGTGHDCSSTAAAAAAAAVGIASAVRVHELTREGEALTAEGETARACFVVLRGELDVAVAGWGHTASALGGHARGYTAGRQSEPHEHGAPVATLRVGPGACLGARTMVLGTPRDFSATAASAAGVVVLSLSRRDYQEAMLQTVAAAALERVPALAALSARARARALRSLRHQARPPGSMLFEAGQGDAEQSLYVVGSGSIQLVKPAAAGSNPSFERHLRWPTAGAARAAAAAAAAETRGKGTFRRGGGGGGGEGRGVREGVNYGPPGRGGAGGGGGGGGGGGVVRRCALTGGRFLAGVPVARLLPGAAFGEASLVRSAGPRTCTGYCLGGAVYVECS
jgi:CRP-like cAMP-binding protein